MRLTLVFGYLAFAVIGLNALYMLVMPMVTFAPWSMPVTSTSYWVLVVLALAELLPLLLGLLMGETARNHSRLERHYNGLLLGVVAHMLAQSLALINSLQLSPNHTSAVKLSIFDYWPIWLTVALVLMVGLMYYGTRSTRALVQFRPFQMFAGISAVALAVASIPLFMPKQYSIEDLAFGVMPVVLLAIGLAISYLMSHIRTSRAARLADACVGMAWLFVALVATILITMVFPRLVPGAGPLLESLLLGAPLIAWLVFLWLANRGK